MVKPGGTGRPRLAISARLARLPPSRSRSSALPSALPSPNVKTHLPDLIGSAPALLAAGLVGRLAAGFVATFFNAFRAEAGAGLALAGADGFDFATIFLGLATLFAMTSKQSARGEQLRAYTILDGPAQAG